MCNEIDQWPTPTPGLTLNLPVMGVMLQVRKVAVAKEADSLVLVLTGANWY